MALRCLFLHNTFCGVALHGSCSVSLTQCTFLDHEHAAFQAVFATNASLDLFNVSVDRRWWVDERRPGTLHEREAMQAPLQKKRKPPGEEPLQALFDFVTNSAEGIIHDWMALCMELEETAEPVLLHLEDLVRRLGGEAERMRTGRQRLRLPRSEVVENPFQDPDDPEFNSTAVELFREQVDREFNDTDPEFETLPPLLLASFSKDAPPDAPTLCVYVHLEPSVLSSLGVAERIHDPQALLIENSNALLSKRRYGGDALRAFSFLAALQCFGALEIQPPVHLKVIFDLLEDAHLDILHKRITRMRNDGGFLEGVDSVVLLQGEWLSPLQPAVVTGYRGLATFLLSVECAEEDLHSGFFGGGVREAFPELMHLLASLQDAEGRVLVEAISKWDGNMTEQEREDLRHISMPPPTTFSIASWNRAALERRWSKEEMLCKTWHRPSLSIHGVEGAWASEGVKSVIPSCPTAKLSVRLAPGMTPTDVHHAIQHHLETKFASFRSPNHMTLRAHTAWRAWRGAHRGRLLDAAARATERVHGTTPDLICNGGSSPMPGVLEEALGGRGEVVVLPLWHREEELASDEQLRQTQGYLIEGIKLAAALMDETARNHL